VTLKRRKKKKRKLSFINQAQGIGEAVEAGAGLHHFCDFIGLQPLKLCAALMKETSICFC